MTPAPSAIPPLSRPSSGSTTPTQPAPEPTYTFHWICPRPSCHTCTTRSRPAAYAPEGQFDNYEDMQQYEHEWEHEEMGSVTMTCTPQCRARQVSVGNEAKVLSQWTGRHEWAYVVARCEGCGRTAGRNSTLVEIQRT